MNDSSRSLLDETGVVVIGRNEGDRLRRCLDSLRQASCTIIYVDSGSADDSIGLAVRAGADVVALDMTTAFTAARARNAGFHRLMQLRPQARYVQFVDGDCEVVDDWLETATAFLAKNVGVACVCGRLRERYPERSIYNRLCDAEWDRVAGEVDACGGIALIRTEPFIRANGFREDLIGGEEPELCSRIRSTGLTIWRLESPMAWHDAAMLRFGQWWMRSKRTGYGYAQALWIGGARAQPAQTRRASSSWIWAGLVPALIGAGLLLIGWPALVALALYPIQVIRVATRVSGSTQLRLERGFFLVLGRFPELVGQLQFFRSARRVSRSAPTFDYKA